MNEICKRGNCTGCMACMNMCNSNAIEMKMDEKGFWYPYINQKLCTNCGMCVNICHINNKPQQNGSIQKEVFAMWSLDNVNRFESSSGGAFSELAKVILDDGGVVFGAYWNDELKVVHGGICSFDELSKLRKSKYVQSSIDYTYNEAINALKEGKKVLFSGTPCQIAGLLNVVPKNLREKLYTVDLFCFGVSSPGVFEDYKTYVESKYGKKIKRIDFRTKNTGWKRYTMCLVLEDNIIIQKAPQTSLWLNSFMEGLTIRESCKQCCYNNLERMGDISLGDYWKYAALNKDEFDDDMGISSVIVNTEKGKQLFDTVRNKNYVSIRSIEDIITKQKRALDSKKLPNSNYDEFWNKYFNEGFYNASKKYIREGEEAGWKSARKYLVAIDWLMLKQNGKSIASYFERNNYKNIAIYGMGEFGLLLCNELENEDINVVFTMDSERILPYNNIPMISIEQLKDMDDVDAIVVTPVFAFNKIKTQLEKNVKYPIISLEEVVK